MEISLALGGGGIKGIAHIGVIDCLVKAGFIIRSIAGTSMGGLIGAVYAAGYSPNEMQAIIESINPNRMYARQATDRPSLLGYTGLAEALVEVLGESQFTDLKIQFACTAVDIRTSQEVYLNDGLVIDAVLATIAVPGVLPPKLRGESELVDGGILDPVPVNLARYMCPKLPVVAVVLNPDRDDWQQLPQFNIIPPVRLPIPSPLVEGIARMRVAQAFQTFLHSMDITGRMLTELRLEVDRPEVIIRPDVHQYGMFDAVLPKDLIPAGYAAAERAIPQIRKTYSWPNTMLRILRQPPRRNKEQNSHPAAEPPSNGSLP
jgi:NTE family protein